MRQLNDFEKKIIEALTSNGAMSGRALSVTLGLPYRDVVKSIRQIRKQFTRGNQNAVYVHLSKDGYTLEETPENLKYEGMRRLKMGTSIILNGKYVFARYKTIALTDYHRLRIEFQPKSIKAINVLSDDASTTRKSFANRDVIINKQN